jgi:hypothetical protein
VSDPTLNTAQCVVKGQEGSSQKIECPYNSGFRKVVWNYCWFILSTSFIASLAIWYYLHHLIHRHYSDYIKKPSNTITLTSPVGEEAPPPVNNSNNEDTAASSSQAGGEAEALVSGDSNNEGQAASNSQVSQVNNSDSNEINIYIGVTFTMMLYISFFVFASAAASSYFISSTESKRYLIAHICVFVLLLLFGIIYNILHFRRCKSCKGCTVCKVCCFCGGCKRRGGVEGCEGVAVCEGCEAGCKLNCKNCKICKCNAFTCLLPCVYQIVHHLLWILCGIFSEPYWAIPIFLLESLAIFSLLYVTYLYHRDVGPKIENMRHCKIIFHLFVALISFWSILFIVIVIGHGRIVNVLSTGVIEVIATAVFIWMVKISGLQLKDFK